MSDPKTPDAAGLEIVTYEDVDLAAEPWVSYLWGVADQEELDLDPYDTIEAALDVAADLEELPETIELHPWVRHEPNEDEIQRLTELMLGDLFGRLDESYGNPDAFGEREEPGERDRREAVRFVKGVVDRMFIWRCDPVNAIVEVDVERWIRENRADWIESDRWAYDETSRRYCLEPDQGVPATVADVEAAAVEDAFDGEELTISIPRDTAECLKALYGADWRTKVTYHIKGSLEDSLDTLNELAQTLATGGN